jgi:CubicO group peptidase (beta-lactamase class C family)
VTLRQLLLHRSGLPEDRDPGRILVTWGKIFSLEGPMAEQRRAAVEIALAQTPAAPPGETYAYSNLGYTVAGAMLERATGKTWEELVGEKLCRPLGIERFGFGPPGSAEAVDEPRGHRSWGFLGLRPATPGPGADNPAVIGPAGTFHCSIGDWARYAVLHLRGARREEGLLLSPAGFRALHEAAGEYALGWVVTEREWAGGRVLMHDGSNGRWYAVVWIAPERDAAFLAASNLGDEAAAEACDDAIGALIERYVVGK